MSLWDRPNAPTSGAASVPNQIPLNTQGSLPGPLPVTQAINAAAETLIVSAALASVALSCAVAPDTALEQTLFNVVGSGYIKTLAAGNITIKVYEGLVVSAGNLLGSSGAIAQNTATAAFFFVIDAIYDSVSGVLAGTIKFYVNKTAVAAVTFSNFVGGFLNAGNPGANPPTVANLPAFCFSVTSSGADATHTTTVNVAKFSCG